MAEEEQVRSSPADREHIQTTSEIVAELDKHRADMADMGLEALRDIRYAAAVVVLGLLTRQELQAVITRTLSEGEKRGLPSLLTEHEKISYGDMLQINSITNGLAFVPIEHIRIPPHTLSLLPPDIARAHRAIPFRLELPGGEGEKRRLWIILADPGNLAARRAIESYLVVQDESLQIEFICSTPELVDKIIQSRYTSTSDFEDIEDIEDEEAFNEGSSELGPAQEFFKRIFAQAVDLGASDVHVEGSNTGKGLQVRMRIDGVLQLVEEIADKYKDSVMAVMKLQFGMDIAERRKSQSGRASKRIQGREIDLRGETLPAVDSEDIVVRLLDKGALNLDLKDMGFTDDNFRRFTTAYEVSYGAILVTGPTGSGKTSTLYAVLKDLTKETVKLITIEDPVEYRLPGLRQVPVNDKAGRSFPDSLRAILRSDPDIVMVGEIRDEITANIAMRAANTGHLMLSTLHTNEAAAAPIQLINMGVPDYVVADALTVVVGQRLARRLCRSCKKRYVPTETDLRRMLIGYGPEHIEHVVTNRENYPFHQASEGCADCTRGYSGRTAVHEVMVVGDAEKEILLSANRSAMRLREEALHNGGMHTLRQDAIYKSFEGVTSFEEVRRVTNH